MLPNGARVDTFLRHAIAGVADGRQTVLHPAGGQTAGLPDSVVELGAALTAMAPAANGFSVLAPDVALLPQQAKDFLQNELAATGELLAVRWTLDPSATPVDATLSANADAAIALLADVRGAEAGVTLHLHDIGHAFVAGAAAVYGAGKDLHATGDDAAQRMVFGDGGNVLDGGGGDDVLISGAGADTLSGGAGSDLLTGGGGDDIAMYAEPRAGYRLQAAGNGVVRVTAADGSVDTLREIERLQFADGVLDLTVIQAPSEQMRCTALLYRTIFGRVADAGGWNFWLTHDSGPLGLAEAFLDSAEFRARGELDDHAFTALLLGQAEGRPAPEYAVQAWEPYLATHTRAELAVTLADAVSVAGSILLPGGIWLF